jgi:hypothetical protein
MTYRDRQKDISRFQIMSDISHLNSPVLKVYLSGLILGFVRCKLFIHFNICSARLGAIFSLDLAQALMTTRQDGWRYNMSIDLEAKYLWYSNI